MQIIVFLHPFNQVADFFSSVNPETDVIHHLIDCHPGATAYVIVYNYALSVIHFHGKAADIIFLDQNFQNIEL